MVTPIGYGILVGLVVLQLSGAAYLLRLFRRHSEFYNGAHAADGVVSSVVEYSGDDRPSYVYTYTYAVGAKTYAIDEEVYGSWFRRRKGQPVRIYYAPAAPEQGRVDYPSRGPILLGGAFLCAAVGLLLTTLLIRSL